MSFAAQRTLSNEDEHYLEILFQTASEGGQRWSKTRWLMVEGEFGWWLLLSGK